MSREHLSEDPRFDPELKARWLEALRSGRYQQGRQSLRPTLESYCCLGVLCDVIDPQGWDGRRWRDKATGCDHSSKVPIPTERRLALPHEITGTLMHMNDEDEKSFAEIADYIEANL